MAEQCPACGMHPGAVVVDGVTCFVIHRWSVYSRSARRMDRLLARRRCSMSGKPVEAQDA